MAQYDNLQWQQQRKLQAFYEQVNPKPVEPEKAEEPKSLSSKLIRADGECRVFVEQSGDRRHGTSESLVRLVVQAGKEVHQTEMTADEATQLVYELQRVIADAEKTNWVRRDNMLAKQAYDKATKIWEEQREKALRHALKKGNVTGGMIDDAETPDDLPFLKVST